MFSELLDYLSFLLVQNNVWHLMQSLEECLCIKQFFILTVQVYSGTTFFMYNAFTLGGWMGPRIND